MYKIHYYITARGEKVVEDFIFGFDQKTQKKISQFINLLREVGLELRRPYADVVKGKMRELRIRLGPDKIRLLYFFFLYDNIVFVHGFRKKTEKIPLNELEQAERHRMDFILRYQKGAIPL